VFFVVFVILFVWGTGVPEGALARVELQNGHEGDPQDGMGVVSGGNGDPDDGFDVVGDGGDPTNGIGSPLVDEFIFCQNSAIDGAIVELIFLSDGAGKITFFIFESVH